jgi:hypothetical protein
MWLGSCLAFGRNGMRPNRDPSLRERFGVRPIRVGLALVSLPAWACGGTTTPIEGPPWGWSSDSGNAPGAPSSAAAESLWTDAGPPTQIACTTQGLRRDARPDENAQYCVCESVPSTEGGQTTTWLVWSCFGPPSTAQQPSPTTCTYTDVSPGRGDGSCLVNWTSCSDGLDYSLCCVEHDCNCLLQGRRTMVVLEPRDTCPADKASLNALCGWNLQ